jgi:hypothetical protein
MYINYTATEKMIGTFYLYIFYIFYIFICLICRAGQKSRKSRRTSFLVLKKLLANLWPEKREQVFLRFSRFPRILVDIVDFIFVLLNFLNYLLIFLILVLLVFVDCSSVNRTELSGKGVYPTLLAQVYAHTPLFSPLSYSALTHPHY